MMRCLIPISQSAFNLARRYHAENEARRETWRSIDELPQDLRQVAYMILEGWSDREIAVRTYKSRDQLVRLRRRLKKHYSHP